LQRYEYSYTTNNNYKQFNVDNSTPNMLSFAYKWLISYVISETGVNHP